jgi:tight adherence protein B
MIGLAAGLLALAGFFAERAFAITRSHRTVIDLGAPPPDRPSWSPRRSLVLAVGFLLALLLAGPLVGIVGAGGIALTHHAVQRHRRSGRRHRAAEQIADAVSALAAGLRSGLSLPQAFAYARDEADEPLRGELAILVDAIATGTPVAEALADWAAAQGSEDALLIAGVLDLHRRSGGDLPIVLDGLVSTLRERRAAHREVRALTAQARLSGVILGMLPIGFFAFLLLTSRKEILDAIGTPLGSTALGIGLGLEVLAFIWIRHLLEVR